MNAATDAPAGSWVNRLGSLEKLQEEHGKSMARCAGLEQNQTVLEAALAAQRAGAVPHLVLSVAAMLEKHRVTK